MTQATGSAQAQVQEPVHPVHEETAAVESLTKWVQDNPDNDPHSGTDLEEPEKEESKSDETPSQEQKTEEEPKSEVVEFDEETPVFEIEYKTDNGKEQKKLSLKDLREGYLAKQDYHRNIQKVKAQEAALAEEKRLATINAAKEYNEKLELQKQAVSRLAGVKSLQDIEALSKEDPALAQQEFLKMLAVNQQLQAIESEQRQAVEKFQKEQQAAIAEAVAKSRQSLSSDIEGWNDDLYNTVVSDTAKHYGFDGKEVAQVYDARLIKVLHDAYKYRQLQQAKPAMTKKVVAIPKVIKPGSAEKPNPAKEATVHSLDKLKKTGRGEDFVNWYLNKNKKG